MLVNVSQCHRLQFFYFFILEKMLKKFDARFFERKTSFERILMDIFLVNVGQCQSMSLNSW